MSYDATTLGMEEHENERTLYFDKLLTIAIQGQISPLFKNTALFMLFVTTCFDLQIPLVPIIQTKIYAVPPRQRSLVSPAIQP